MKHCSIIKIMCVVVLISSCSASDVKTEHAITGKPSDLQTMLLVANRSGPIELQKHTAANWSVPLSGMLNLDHPNAVTAKIVDRDEKIKLFVYVLTHPSKGTYIIDSGISESFRDAANNPDISFLVKSAMNTQELEVVTTTKELINQNLNKLAGVMLTHIHMDHIMGLGDVGSDVPVYIGPGDVAAKSLEHAATRGTTNRLLKNVTALREWQFDDEGIIDVFGDGSLWAIHSPGHSPGSTAYLVSSTNGPQLIVGDVSHTRWGWDNDVEPGSYSKDMPLGAASLEKLKSIALNYPKIIVHPGHQE